MESYKVSKGMQSKWKDTTVMEVVIEMSAICIVLKAGYVHCDYRQQNLGLPIDAYRLLSRFTR